MTRLQRPDVAVVGAGPAGIAAAVRARQSGASVVVLDDNPSAGGQIWRGTEQSRYGRAQTWLSRFKRLERQTVTNCRVIAAESKPLKLLIESMEGAREVSPQGLILATGAREIFLPFPGWTLPGVMGLGGLQAMAKSGLPVSGKKVVIAGSGPLLLAVAAHLRSHGAHIKLIAEQASRGALARFGAQLIREPGKLAQAVELRLALRGIAYYQSCWIEAAEGDRLLRRVKLRRGTKTWTEDCDYAAVGYGLYPNTELAALLGCKMSGHFTEVDHLQRTTVENVLCAGEATGIGGVDLSIIEGEIAGYAATDQLQRATALFRRRARAQRFAQALNRTFTLSGELKHLPRPDTIICRCEDVSYHRLKAVRSFQEAKLHTRCGMGPCQGRVCGPATDFLFGWGTESVRPPVFPARLSSLALEQIEEETSTAR